MAVIVDVSQVMISGVCIAYSKHKDSLNEDMIRNMFLNSVKSLRSRYISQYGEPFILACDGRDYWRKAESEYYKSQRASGRAASPMDWTMIYASLDKIYQEMQDYFPYPLIKVKGAEADDVISVLAKYFNENEFEWDGLQESKQKVLIISNDMDFIQLQEYDNVYQYSPGKRKFLKEPNPRAARFEKFIRGDKGDGITNMFSPAHCFDTGTRQNSCIGSEVERIVNSLVTTDKLPDDLETHLVEGYERNKHLIDLVDLQLPKEISTAIVDAYKSHDSGAKGTGTIYNYMIKYRLKNLIRDVNKF